MGRDFSGSLLDYEFGFIVDRFYRGILFVLFGSLFFEIRKFLEGYSGFLL